VAFFASVEKGYRNRIIDAMELISVPVGQVICKEGDEADKLYLVVSGTCAVTKESFGNEKIATITELSVFGESALAAYTGKVSKRTATVSAETPGNGSKFGEGSVVLLGLSKDKFSSLVDSGALGPGCVDALKEVANASEKNEETAREIFLARQMLIRQSAKLNIILQKLEVPGDSKSLSIENLKKYFQTKCNFKNSDAIVQSIFKSRQPLASGEKAVGQKSSSLKEKIDKFTFFQWLQKDNERKKEEVDHAVSKNVQQIVKKEIPLSSNMEDSGISQAKDNTVRKIQKAQDDTRKINSLNDGKTSFIASSQKKEGKNSNNRGKQRVEEKKDELKCTEEKEQIKSKQVKGSSENKEKHGKKEKKQNAEKREKILKMEKMEKKQTSEKMQNIGKKQKTEKNKHKHKKLTKDLKTNREVVNMTVDGIRESLAKKVHITKSTSKLAKIFKKLDKDKDGVLCLKEFAILIRQLTHQKCVKLIKECYVSALACKSENSGGLDFDTLCAFITGAHELGGI